MDLDDRRCYRALGARDERFDGRFFVGVVTTGIYCRPICPARTPLARNVRFYPTAAAAAEAGFRPCLRCRPEASPGTPAWRGTSATVTRALRLLADGALDRADVESLAARVGVGERHLRRLFRDHIGATPVAVAQTQRLHLAKKLIDETRLPMTEIAFAAGYSSIRRFNAALKRTYGVPPSTLRRERRKRGKASNELAGAGEGGALELRLAYRRPYPLKQVLGFLADRATRGVEQVAGRCYRRSVLVDGAPAVVEVAPAGSGDALVLRVPHSASRSLARIVDGVRRIFDLDADPQTIRQQLSRDPLVAAGLAKSPGLRVPGAWDGFELAVRAILGQQVSVAAATTLSGVLVEKFGDAIPLNSAADGDPAIADGAPSHLFPGPERLADADVASIGMPRKRGEAIQALARAVCDGELHLVPGHDPEAEIEALTTLPGIGPWTASYVAMRALREPDAFPAGDLVLRQIAGEGSAPLSTRALLERSECWRPWRAYAVLALWGLRA